MNSAWFAVAALTFAIPASAAGPARAHLFDCQVRLASAAGVSTPTPVTIAFTVQGKTMTAIRVVDAGGILSPGANLAMSKRADGTVVMGGKPVPAERPGQWAGRASKKAFDLELSAPGSPKAVVMKLGVKPASNGELALLWQAVGEPLMPGLPGISGSGDGVCRAALIGAAS